MPDPENDRQDEHGQVGPPGPQGTVPMDAEPAEDQGAPAPAVSPGALVGIMVPAEPGLPPASPEWADDTQGAGTAASHEDEEAP